MDYESRTIEELDAELERLDAERLSAKERGRLVMEVRNRKLAELETAKRLGKHRQHATTQPVTVGVKGVK